MATPNPTIKIAEDALPRLDEKGESSSRGRAGGVYLTRSYTRQPPPFRRSSSRASNERHERLEDDEDDDAWQREGGRRKQVFKGTTLLWLAYQSVGVIYGDIGTSPLYVYSSTFTDTPTYNDILQVLSLIIWSLTIVVTLKYVVIVLHADNEGEGGTFSCYSLLTRHANLTERDPREQALVRMQRRRTEDLRPDTNVVRHTLEKSKFLRGLLKTIGVLAVSMVLSDGVLTPAQSVLGAIQGTSVVNPNVSTSAIVGITCGILVLLFCVQPFGITKLASTFAPIVILWLSFNFGFGIYNLVKHDHSVLKAFSPAFAIHFFVEKKEEGWRMLGGVLLAFTGVEALFADLGAFSMRAIQISWLGFCYPCLLVAYIGQAAYLADHPEQYTNPFYNSVPPGMVWPSLIVATLAAIVASQAIITASFQLVSQMLKLSYCPQVKIVHTSKKFFGQLYVPFVNFLLMGGTILVTAVYSNTTRLGNAYGVCVMFVTFFDTCMVTLVSLIVWRIPPYFVCLPWLFFAAVDGLFISSALTKVPDGAWFTLMIAAILSSTFLLWRFGKENQWRAEAQDRFKTSSLVTKNDQGTLSLTERWGGADVTKLRGLGIYFDKTGVLTPMVFTQFVTKFGALPEIMIFFHLHSVEKPTVAADERYVVSHLGTLPGCYRLVVRSGFMDEVISPDLATLIYEQVRKHIMRQAGRARRRMDEEAYVSAYQSEADVESQNNGTTTAAASGVQSQSSQPTMRANANANFGGNGNSTSESTEIPMELNDTESKGPIEMQDETVRAQLAQLDRAYATKIMYVVGKEQMKVKTGTSIPRRVLLEMFLWVRENTRNKIQNLRLAMDRIVEVGFIKEI